MQSNTAVGTVFPHYVSVDIFNGGIYCNQFVCDWDRLKEFEPNSFSTTSANSTDSDSDDAWAIGVTYWWKWTVVFSYSLSLFLLFDFVKLTISRNMTSTPSNYQLINCTF